jgi:hypothetical protein
MDTKKEVMTLGDQFFILCFCLLVPTTSKSFLISKGLFARDSL